MLVCELLVSGLGVNARVKRIPVLAKSSKAGVMNLVVTVTVDVVGAQRINGDQENVGRRCCSAQARHQKKNQGQPHTQLV